MSQSNREKLQALLADLKSNAGLTQKDAAEYLERKTRRPLSLRTFASYLTSPELPSARPCPDWVISELKKFNFKKP